VGMVERCKRVLSSLEGRGGGSGGENQSTTMSRDLRASAVLSRADYKVAEVTRRIGK